MKKMLSIFTASMLFLLTGVFAQAEVNWLGETENLSDAVLEKTVDVSDGNKKIWCTFNLANWSDATDSWEYGPEITYPSTKMTFVQNDTAYISVYAWRETAAMTAFLNGYDYETWTAFLLTMYEKNMSTGNVDTFYMEMTLDGYGYFSPEPYIEVSIDGCSATVDFLEEDHGLNDNSNIYMDIKKIGTGVVWSKCAITSGTAYETSTMINEPGNYIATVIGWKIVAGPPARDTVKVNFTVTCDEFVDGEMKVISSPVIKKGIKIIKNKPSNVFIYNISGQEIYRGESSEKIIPVSVPGTYIVATIDKESGIKLTQKVVVQ